MQDRMIEETRQAVQQSANSLLRSEGNRAERRRLLRRSQAEEAAPRGVYRPRRRKLKR